MIHDDQLKAENETEAAPDTDAARSSKRRARENIWARETWASPHVEARKQATHPFISVSGCDLDGRRPACYNARYVVLGAYCADGSGPGTGHRSGRTVGTCGATAVGQEFPADGAPVARRLEHAVIP